MSASKWCEDKRDHAKDGAEAWNYQQLADLWKQREQNNGQS